MFIVGKDITGDRDIAVGCCGDPGQRYGHLGLEQKQKSSNSWILDIF